MSRKKFLWFKRYRAWIGLLKFAPALWLAAFMLFDITIMSIFNCQDQKVLTTEINQLVIIPDAILNKEVSYCGAGKASVQRNYLGPQTRDEILAYYDKELIRLGWNPLKQQDLSLDGTAARYCKENYTASIIYSDPRSGRNHYLAFNSGLISPCEMMKGGKFLQIPFHGLWFSLGCSVSWLMYAVIMFSVIWRKDSYPFVKLDKGVIRGEPLPRSFYVWEYRIKVTVIMVLCAVGISISLYKIMLYLTNSIFP